MERERKEVKVVHYPALLTPPPPVAKFKWTDTAAWGLELSGGGRAAPVIRKPDSYGTRRASAV